MSGFASTKDLADKNVSFEELGPGLYGYTAEGDPNSGVVIGDDSVLVVDAQATPAMAHDVIARIRTVTDKPVKHVVLSHYHAVRVLGASGYEGAEIIASDVTRDLIVERGQQDMDSEIGRFPRLFRGKEGIPGLTWPRHHLPQAHDAVDGRARGADHPHRPLAHGRRHGGLAAQGARAVRGRLRRVRRHPLLRRRPLRGLAGHAGRDPGARAGAARPGTRPQLDERGRGRGRPCRHRAFTSDLFAITKRASAEGWDLHRDLPGGHGRRCARNMGTGSSSSTACPSMSAAPTTRRRGWTGRRSGPPSATRDVARARRQQGSQVSRSARLKRRTGYECRHPPQLGRDSSVGRRIAGVSDRLRQRLRDRGAARRASGGPQLAAEVPLRALRRAAQRLALYGAADHERAELALPHPADGRPLGQVPEAPISACGAPRPVPRRRRSRPRRCAGTRSRSRTKRSPSCKACAP